MAEQQIATRIVEMSHGRTRYFEAGSGPELLLVHGAGYLSGGHSWFGVLPALARSFHVLAPDCLGFGPGDRLGLPYSFAYMVDHLREFQDVLGVSSSHVVGHSMGGWLGTLLAYESPGRVERFVNVAGGGAATRALRTMVDWQPPSEDEARAAAGALARTDDEAARLARPLVELVHDEAAIAAFRALMAHMTDPETRRRYSTLRRLAFVRAPSLVLWGADDEVNPVALGETTAALLPDARLVVLDGIGHNVAIEAPGAFVAEVSAFLGP